VLTLAETGSVVNGLTSLLGVASLARAVAYAVGPVGLRAEAGSVASSTAEFSVGDEVHVVNTQLLEGVSTVCKQCQYYYARLEQELTAQEPRFWAVAAPAMAARRIIDCFILTEWCGEQRLLGWCWRWCCEGERMLGLWNAWLKMRWVRNSGEREEQALSFDGA